MTRAIELAAQTAIVDKAGGPFGCVIVKDGEVLSEGVNRVVADHDPTSHGEMNAIRSACSQLGTHNLSGCTLYTSGEPCPMCYAACCWAHVDAIYYASTSEDAKQYGDFDDCAICESFQVPIAERLIDSHECMRENMLELWKQFVELPEKPHY